MATPSPVYSTIEFEVGESFTDRYTVKKGESDYSVAASEIIWMCKRNLGDPDSQALIDHRKSAGKIYIADNADHVCYLHLTPAQTRLFKPGEEYRWSLRLVSASGQTSTTVIHGRITPIRGAQS
jgi:hypothetical protein